MTQKDPIPSPRASDPNGLVTHADLAALEARINARFDSLSFKALLAIGTVALGIVARVAGVDVSTLIP